MTHMDEGIEGIASLLARAEERNGYPLHVTMRWADGQELMACVLPVKNGPPRWIREPRFANRPEGSLSITFESWDEAETQAAMCEWEQFDRMAEGCLKVSGA